MHTQATPRYPNEGPDEAAERAIRIVHVLLERAGDDLENLARTIDDETLRTSIESVEMTVALAEETLPVV